MGEPCLSLNSSDNVRRVLVFDKGDAVAQLKFALLQALQTQQIRRGRLLQRLDCGIEIAMFLLQPRKLGGEFVIVLLRHRFK